MHDLPQLETIALGALGQGMAIEEKDLEEWMTVMPYDVKIMERAGLPSETGELAERWIHTFKAVTPSLKKSPRSVVNGKKVVRLMKALGFPTKVLEEKPRRQEECSVDDLMRSMGITKLDVFRPYGFTRTPTLDRECDAAQLNFAQQTEANIRMFVAGDMGDTVWSSRRTVTRELFAEDDEIIARDDI